MANIPPPLHESEGFLPVADASCSAAIFLLAQHSLINGITTKIPHIFLFPSHPRYSVALRAPCESRKCGVVRRLAKQDAFALMPHKVSSLSPRGKLFRMDLTLRYFAGTPILANIPPPLHESEGYYNKKGADNTSALVVRSARELNRRCCGA